jgi:hypothetical protein
MNVLTAVSNSCLGLVFTSTMAMEAVDSGDKYFQEYVVVHCIRPDAMRTANLTWKSVHVQFRWDHLFFCFFFFKLLTLQPHYGPGVDSNCFWGVEHGRRIRLTSSPFVGRLSRQCGILNISHPCRLPQPVTGIAVLCFNVVAGRGWEARCFAQFFKTDKNWEKIHISHKLYLYPKCFWATRKCDLKRLELEDMY